MAMGFDLSFPKAQDSDVEKVATWTSARLELHNDDDDSGIKVINILTEVADVVKDMMKVYAVGVDILRTLAGRST